MMEPLYEEPRRRDGYARRATRVAGQGSERLLAAAAHAALGFGLVGIGFFLSLVITGVIWLSSKRLPFVAEHADRAGRYQLFVFLANVLIVVSGIAVFLILDTQGWWASGGLRAAVLLLVLLGTAFVFGVWYFASIFYGLYAALRVLGGHDFSYPAHPLRRRRHQRALDWPLRWDE